MKAVFSFNLKTNKLTSFLYNEPGPLPPIVSPPDAECPHDTGPPEPETEKPEPKPS